MLQITVRQNLQTQKQFLPPRRLTTEQLTHCSIYSIYIYPCTSCTLHFFFALLLCNISQLLYIAIPPCIYFLKLLSPLHCCTVCLFVLYCIVLYILCKHTESHFTKSNSLFVQTYLANKTWFWFWFWFWIEFCLSFSFFKPGNIQCHAWTHPRQEG